MLTRRRIALQLLGTALALTWAGAAGANHPIYSLTGNLRLGFGYPSEVLGVVPYTPAPTPTGRIVATGMAQVTQLSGMDPLVMVFTPTVLTAMAVPRVTPVFLANTMVLQASSSLAAHWPKAVATFSAGGRTGAATVSFCPGQVVPPLGNPGCLTPQGGSHSGRLRYMATSSQFGGPGPPHVSGVAGVHLRVAGTPPCDAVNGPGPCTAGLVALGPPNTVAIGASFGFVTTTTSLAAPNLFKVNALAGGTILSKTAGFSTSPAFAHTVTSFGGPWTTGMLTVSVTDNSGPLSHVFMLTGADARVNGIGAISLVAGSLVTRTPFGTTGNRGWLNLTVPEPASALGSAAALGFLGVLHALVRTRRSGRR